MWWLLLVVILIIAGFAVPRFGKVLLATVVAVVVVGGAYLYETNRRQDVERAAAKTRIAIAEVQLIDLLLQPGYSSGVYTLVGRLRNGSAQYSLTSLRLKLTMQDCADLTGCETVGEVVESIYASVPPGQSRDLNEFVSFTGLGRARGKHQWDYALLEVNGQ